MTSRHARAIGFLVVALAALQACGGGEPERSSTPTPSAVDRPRSTAELAVTSPDDGAILRGSTIDLRVNLDGARIVSQTTTELAADEGHLHVLLDDELVSMTEGTRQRISDVSAGLHRLTVEFVANDHAPFDPRVVTTVVFEVRP
jgi:ABC-type uncharacterized transport system ATPase component